MTPTSVTRILTTVFSGVVACTLALSGLLLTTRAGAADSYTFAVVPQFEQRKLFAIWKPIIDDVNRRTGLNITLATTLSIPAFEQGLEKGAYDFVYSNPYHILKAHDRQGYIPLVRDAAALRGILVVRQDSPLRHPGDMSGKALAVPSPNALGASLLLRADLENLYKARVKMVNVQTHSAVYMNVLAGVVEAGGGVEKTFSEQPANVQDGLRVLYTTRDMPSHPVAAHPRVPEAVRTRVRQALLALAGTPEGAAMMAKVPLTRLVATDISDYTVMRSWGLDRYWVNDNH